ncbi:MAG: hypothetical protein H6730_28590 [Deltaproteobacteria bacterium]|nr:hypothetical protein [Deltaproteobacteria bacterium]
MKRKVNAWGWAALLALLGVFGCGESSSPELCDEACQLWDACVGADDWYTYEVCIVDCRAEGDWRNSYVDCLREHSTCTDMELYCG